MVACGVEYVVQEVSAHALYYHKDECVHYAAAIFTNLTQDHLDFFGDMGRYKKAKMRLFSPQRCEIAIINGDDEAGQEILSLRKGTHTQTYAMETPADCFAITLWEGICRQQFMLNLNDDLCRVSLKMTGKHNVYNALAAAACAHSLGVNAATIAAGLNEVVFVRGRLQYVAEHSGGKIFVDFAHTPDGLSRSLSALRPHAKGRLICVFGCGGNRDKTKRPLMGEVAARGADFCVLTSDNPRFEDPLDILDEIEKGYKKYSNAYVVVSDRKRAIEYAMEIIREGDVLLIAGKGGEDTQEIMGIKHPFDDQDVVGNIIKTGKKLV
jgi:UDP-N-acetylmuramoyl-L-alanyl-D-glutamate--2,6-diaminopimelate ligase